MRKAGALIYILLVYVSDGVVLARARYAEFGVRHRWPCGRPPRARRPPPPLSRRPPDEFLIRTRTEYCAYLPARVTCTARAAGRPAARVRGSSASSHVDFVNGAVTPARPILGSLRATPICSYSFNTECRMDPFVFDVDPTLAVYRNPDFGPSLDFDSDFTLDSESSADRRSPLGIAIISISR